MHTLLSGGRRPGALRDFGCAVLCALILAGCESAVAPDRGLDPSDASRLAQQASTPARPAVPVLQSSTPYYPAIALYIVYREYLHLNPGLTTLRPDDRQYQNYVEKRMRELYPHRGYAGMMREAVEEARQNRRAWEQYERDLRAYERRTALTSGTQPLSFLSTSTCGSTLADPYAGADPSWTGQTEFAVPPDEALPTIQMEIDSLQLVGTEVDNIYYYESLATGTYAGGGGGGGGGGGDPIIIHGLPGEPTIDDLIRAAAQGHTPANSSGVTIQVNPTEVAEVVVALALIPWKAYRVYQSVDRSRRKAQEFYPHLSEADTKRDAYRHIFWNMMLRR